MNLSAMVLFATVALVGFLWTYGVHRAAGLVKESRIWTLGALVIFLLATGIYWLVGISGAAQNFSGFPPPFAFFFLSLFVLSLTLSFSKFGTLLTHLSFSALVTFQGFRFLAEFLIYRALQEGLAPIQMSFEGRNFDIWVALSALLIGFYVRNKENRKLIWVFQAFGLISLINIAVIAILSMPTPFRYFLNEPSNIWVTTAPYIFLPGILVSAAWTGHLILFRKLCRT